MAKKKLPQMAEENKESFVDISALTTDEAKIEGHKKNIELLEKLSASIIATTPVDSDKEVILASARLNLIDRKIGAIASVMTHLIHKKLSEQKGE